MIESKYSMLFQVVHVDMVKVFFLFLVVAGYGLWQSSFILKLSIFSLLPDSTYGTGITAIKLTALGRPQLLVSIVTFIVSLFLENFKNVDKDL